MAKRATKTPKAESVLVELLTEELPPKSLRALAAAFRDTLYNELKDAGLSIGGTSDRVFATPRRLAALIPGVLAKGANVNVVPRGFRGIQVRLD